MGDVLKRKCAVCNRTIEIDRNNIVNILQFQGKYYHSQCFKDLATQKAASKRGKPYMWMSALDDIEVLEMETKKILERSFYKDDLTSHILDNYNVITIPNRFWQAISELESGQYKGKRCKPVDIHTLCGCWKWGQKKLNEINQYNRGNNKGPSDDELRLMYDLAILVSKMPNYLAYKAKREAVVNEIARSAAVQEVDMSKVGQKKQQEREDVSDIFNDLYVE